MLWVFKGKYKAKCKGNAKEFYQNAKQNTKEMLRVFKGKYKAKYKGNAEDC